MSRLPWRRAVTPARAQHPNLIRTGTHSLPVSSPQNVGWIPRVAHSYGGQLPERFGGSIKFGKHAPKGSHVGGYL